MFLFPSLDSLPRVWVGGEEVLGSQTVRLKRLESTTYLSRIC